MDAAQTNRISKIVLLVALALMVVTLAVFLTSGGMTLFWPALALLLIGIALKARAQQQARQVSP